MWEQLDEHVPRALGSRHQALVAPLGHAVHGRAEALPSLAIEA